MIAPARAAVYRILLNVSTGRMDLATAVADARRRLEDDRDRALASEIATGVQRWRAALDYLIVSASKRPLEKLDPEVVEVLRLSAYQLLHLTRVPAAAVVDDGVNLVRSVRRKSAAGFVNAVLRSIVRQRNALPLPRRPDDAGNREAALDYLSITLSHPRWLVSRWYDRYGFEATERWLLFDNAPAPLTLRANRLRLETSELIRRLAAEGVTVRAGRFAPDALVVEHGRLRRETGGLFVLQDEASQLVALAAGRDPGFKVLDACASPGGKTLGLAAMMAGHGLLVASDLRQRRIELLRRTLTSAGAGHVRIVRADLLQPLPFRASFDTVLVDAPCSGLGVLRRDPDIRWRRREDDLAVLAASELVMLQHAADVVAPGGRLIYATCSGEPEENESVADAFLATTPEFTPVDLRDARTLLPAETLDANGRLRTLPHVHDLEAFFAAAFERRR
jgi:16S rRNA (cytosine967-C5)-methyltransferase